MEHPKCWECGYFQRTADEALIRRYERGLITHGLCYFRPPTPTGEGRCGYPQVSEKSPCCGMFYPRGGAQPKLSRLMLLIGGTD